MSAIGLQGAKAFEYARARMQNDTDTQGSTNSDDLPEERSDDGLRFSGTKQMENFGYHLVKKEGVKAKYGLSEEDLQALIQPLSKEASSPAEHEASEPNDGNIKYLNIITNFDERLIWREGAREEREDFRKSLIRDLWKLLLENKGIPLSKMEIRRHMEERADREKDKHKFNLGQTLDNLKRKLAAISGEERKTVASWFEETPTTLSVRNLG